MSTPRKSALHRAITRGQNYFTEVHRRHAAVIIILALVIYLVWFFWLSFLPANLADEPHLDKKGQYGDSYGTLNTLFTGLAFAGVAFSIYLQLHGASEREEERLIERFESRFFRLNDSLRLVVNSMTVREELHEPNITGKDVFGVYARELSQRILIARKRPSESPIELNRQCYEAVYLNHQDDLGPYFRMLYNLFCYVDRSKIKNKRDYTDILRAELSASEVCLLAINCLTENGRRFKPLVEKYEVLKHMPTNGTASSQTGSG